MKALVGAFNQEKALVGAFSVIVQLRRFIVYSANHRSRHSDDTLYPALSHSQYTVFDLIRETPQR